MTGNLLHVAAAEVVRKSPVCGCSCSCQKIISAVLQLQLSESHLCPIAAVVVKISFPCRFRKPLCAVTAAVVRETSLCGCSSSCQRITSIQLQLWFTESHFFATAAAIVRKSSSCSSSCQESPLCSCSCSCQIVTCVRLQLKLSENYVCATTSALIRKSSLCNCSCGCQKVSSMQL